MLAIKSSSYLKKYFKQHGISTSQTSLEDSSSFVVQLAFSSNKDALVVRSLVNAINQFSQKGSLINFSFFNQGSLINGTGFSSFNYLVFSKNELILFALIEQMSRLGLSFSILSNQNFLTSYKNNFLFKTQNQFFSLKLFKAFENNKLILSAFFLKELGVRFLVFLKKIEYFNTIRILKLANFLTQKL
jgi:hypothetical protein